jgi:4-amino-4-deoxy-L-arabinose transferase-like glycosyltransferase
MHITMPGSGRAGRASFWCGGSGWSDDRHAALETAIGVQRETNPVSSIADRASGKYERLISSLILVLSLCLFAVRVPLLFVRFFDQDELEHFHGAWNISQGQLIYVDFFEHHPPAIHYLLQLPIWITGDTFATVYGARVVMLLFVGAVVWLTYLVARRVGGPLVAAASVLMLNTMVLFLEKTLEIRPDVPMTFCWVASLWLVMRGFNEKTVHFVSAGAMLALGMLFSPKIVFGYFGMLLTLCLLVFVRVRPGINRRCLLAFHLGLLIPGLPFLLWLLLAGNLVEFWQTNVLFNAQMNSLFSISMLKPLSLDSFRQNFLFWIAGAFGIATLVRLPPRLFREKSILLISLVFLLARLLVSPVPDRQSYLLFIPVVSVTGGLFLVSISRTVIRWRRGIGGALAVILLVTALLPLREIPTQFSKKNDQQLQVIRYVLEITRPEESVFDAWTQLYLFRRNASYYHFLNLDILRTLDLEELERLPEELVRNNCKVVLVDIYFQLLPAGVRQFIRQNYHQSPKASWILIRNDRAFEAER